MYGLKRSHPLNRLGLMAQMRSLQLLFSIIDATRPSVLVIYLAKKQHGGHCYAPKAVTMRHLAA